MIYSSPFWMMFPDEFIQNLYNWNSEATVFILDLLSAIILTFITMFLLISITFIGDKFTILITDRSWHHPSKLIIKKGAIKRLSIIRKKIKRSF